MGVFGEAVAGRMDVLRKFAVWVGVVVVSEAAGEASNTLTAYFLHISLFCILVNDSKDTYLLMAK